MTVDESKDKINHKFVVKCRSISERNQTLELLIALGYEVNEPSMEYLKPGYQDFHYPHPIMERGGSRICCTRYADDKENLIQFAEITTLVDYLDSSIDERSNDEFAEALATLMS